MSLAAGMFAILLTGCSTEPDAGTGTMQVRMHDAPADFDEVNIYIERVEVNREEGDEGWQVLSEPDRIYNLLELVNGAYEVLGEAELETGTYRQIRLIVNQEESHVVENGEVIDLTVPSGAQTGLKLNVDAEILPDIDYILQLDFDADRSIVKPGQSGMGYLLKPVIRATNLANTGIIAGEITPEARAAAYAILDAGTAEADTVSTTFADEDDGQFRLLGLPANIYTVSVEPREEGYLRTDVEDVEVIVGETTELDPIVLDTDGSEDPPAEE